MTPTILDLMRAVDELEIIFAKVFKEFAPLYDGDEHTMRRALAILHAYIEEHTRS